MKNTGTAAPIPAGAHTKDVSTFANNDIYRLSVTVDGSGWSAALPSALVSVPFGGSVPAQLFVSRTASSSKAATITVTATSETDPTKRATAQYTWR